MFKIDTTYSRNLKILSVFSFIFLCLILCNHIANFELLRGMIQDQQTNTIKAASKRISTWFQQKIDSMEVIRDFVSQIDHKNNYASIKQLLINNTQVADFKNIYVGYENNDIISGLDWVQNPNYVTTKRPWYKDTLEKNKTIVTAPYKDVGLNEVVVSICTPLHAQVSMKKGIICGILPLEKIKNEILDISLPYDGIAFIVNYYGKIILHPDSNKHLTISHFKGYNSKNFTIVGEEFKDGIFSQDRIRNSDWYIVAQLDKSSVYEKINTQLFLNLAIYFMGLLTFLLLNYFYYKREKTSENNLIKSKAILRHFVDHGDYGVIIEDDNEDVIYYNSVFMDFLGLQDTLDIGRINLKHDSFLFDILPKEIKENILDKIEDVRQYRRNEVISFTLEKNNKTTYYRLDILPVMSRKNIYQGFIIFYKDITLSVQSKIEQKEHEAIMFQQSKMADLGEMIAAVSHQWRQPLNSLSIMLGNLLQFKQANQLTDEIFEENLKYSMSNVHYLAKTIDTFRNFYRPSKHAPFHLTQATQEVFEVIMPHLKTANITLKIEEKGLKECQCLNFKNEYQQIMINLLHNAKDAILEDKNNNKQIIVRTEFKDQTFHIEVQDFGNGINESIRPKLFQSFQTTKKENGTGKGLYISKLIARKKLKGDLTVKNYNNPTIFLITIPCQEEKQNA